MHNNAHLTYICTYIHIITHITHVVNTYKHNYMKILHKFGHIRVNFLQSVRLQVTQTPSEFVGVLSLKVDPHTL